MLAVDFLFTVKLNIMEEITHNGSLSTSTIFKKEDGSKVKISVWLTTEHTISNQHTYYNCNIETKGKSCRNWVFEFNARNSTSEHIFDYITKEQLYQAYYNHWMKLNPIRLFSKGQINSKLNIDMKEKEHPKEHFAY